MGRELKRVPIDFQWPIGQIWKGYLNPFRSFECKACEGTGLNPETKKIDDEWYSFDKQEYVYFDENKRYNKLAWSNNLTQEDVDELVKEGRLIDFTHTFVSGEGWKKKNPEYHPTAQEVNEWQRGPGFGHDSINRWICRNAKAKRLGVYGLCPVCDDGQIWQTPEIKKLHDEWKSFEPPTGEGFQLWETTSEGSPKSPVFKTIDDLCEWCSSNATTFASFKATKEEWRKMLDNDFVSHNNYISFFF